MLKYLKGFGAFLFAAVLIWFGFEYLLSDEQRSLFFSTPAQTHLVSILLVFPVFFSGGIGLRLLYSRMSNTRLSVYDTLTLPVVINLWGFIIPFQGSFIYTLSYIKSKYRKSLSDSVRVYLLSFSISMSVAGFIGMIFYLSTNMYVPRLFFLVSFLLFINPGFLYLISMPFDIFNSPEPGWIKKGLDWAGRVFSFHDVDGKLIFNLVLVNILHVAVTTLWSYWIVISLNLNLTIIQLILIALLMKLTLLVKLTPGNVGISQFASGGITLLVGGTASDGFLLSSFQYISIIFVSFTLGTLCTIINMKYFKWQKNDSAV